MSAKPAKPRKDSIPIKLHFKITYPSDRLSTNRLKPRKAQLLHNSVLYAIKTKVICSD